MPELVEIRNLWLHQKHEFDDSLPRIYEEVIEAIDGPSYEQLQTEIEKGFDVVFSIGTTSVFPYIQAPIYSAKSAGNVAVEINPGESTISHMVDYRLAMRAGAALEEIWKRLQAANN